MLRKKIVNILQNATLIALTASALFLLTQFPMLKDAMTGQMQALLSSSETTAGQNGNLSSAITMVHLAVTGDYEYGRYLCLNAAVEGAEFQRCAPLFREAIGSAASTEEVSERVFRKALNTPCLYIDLAASLPLSAVAAWLGESYDDDTPVRALALVAAQETAMLYFYREDGTVTRCTSALTSTAVRESTAAFTPNGGQFAFESQYPSLAPYTLLAQDSPTVPAVEAAVPAGCTAYNLLTALDFNAHTTARYYESSGVEVIVQSPLTLRVGTDGVVQYSADGTVPAGLYRVACAGDTPTAQEALQTTLSIAEALCRGTGAASLSLCRMEQTERGWILSLRYHVEGVPVRLTEDRAALRVVVEGSAVTEFTYYCRSYTAVQEPSQLLPMTMAAAIAALRQQAEPVLTYVDNGAAVLQPCWLAQ